MNGERGVILVLVAWTLTALVILAGELARTMRIEGLTADTYQHQVAAQYVAMAGLHRALYQFLRAPQQGRALFTPPGAVEPGLQKPGEEEKPQDIWARGDGRWHTETFGAGGYWVRVSDESGKIDLNQVDEAALRQAFANLNFEAKFSEALTDAILDWRDSDPLVRLHGAESDDYLALPFPYPAKDGPFDTPDELLLVRGVTPALFYGRDGPGLRDLFTVYSSGGRGTTNLLTASPLVLQALLGIDAATAQDLVQRRLETGGSELAGFMGRAAGRVVNSLPSVVTIDSIGYLNNEGITHRLSAVIQRQGVNGFRVLRWQDRQDATDGPEPQAAEPQP